MAPSMVARRFTGEWAILDCMATALSAPWHGVGEAGSTGRAAAPALLPCSGTLDIGTEGAPVLRGPTGHLADTYLALHGWGKGLAWLNGFHLGW